jgi:hypothetical protein
MSEAKRTTYQDKPLLMLQSKNFVLTIGNSKAKLILDHIEDIKLFVESNVKTEVK